MSKYYAENKLLYIVYAIILFALIIGAMLKLFTLPVSISLIVVEALIGSRIIMMRIRKRKERGKNIKIIMDDLAKK